MILRLENASKSSPQRQVVAVAALLLTTALAALFGMFFNRRNVTLEPWLQAIPVVDSLDGGNSRSRVVRNDSCWVVRYALGPACRYPYAGVSMELKPSMPRSLRDFRAFDRMLLVTRLAHRGPSHLRIYLNVPRIRKSVPLVFPAEVQYQPDSRWTETVVNLRSMNMPSWFIGMHRLNLGEQIISLDSVSSISFMTPDIYQPTDSGVLEIRSLRLEGDRIPIANLATGILALWIAAGMVYLLAVLRGWRGRIRSAEETARAKSDFLAVMSHEIRTPLNGILAPAQTLLEAGLPSDQANAARTILESGEHLANVLQNVLDSSKLEAGMMFLERIPLDLVELSRGALRTFEGRAREKGVELRLEEGANVPERVLGDPTRLRQVLLNLVSNALKFTEHGRVVLSVAALPSREEGAVALRFAVRDTGIGMDAASMAKLFRKYTQLESSTSRRFGGTGLGLSIAQGLVQAMGGKIEVRSAVGVGSEFTFGVVLSLAMDDAALRKGGQDAPWLGMQVLLVDDDRINRMVATHLLEATGCQAILCESGSNALEYLQRESVGLILLDCHMPGMDGYETARRVRELEAASGVASRATILAFTADSPESVRARCLEAGMDGVLAKPLRKELLLQALQEWGCRLEKND